MDCHGISTFDSRLVMILDGWSRPSEAPPRGEVTGSAFLLKPDEAKVFNDCGILQGASQAENFNRIPRKGASIKLDAVAATDANLDHTRRLPLLTKADYRGPIYATPVTIDVADLILRDSGHLQARTTNARIVGVSANAFRHASHYNSGRMLKRDQLGAGVCDGLSLDDTSANRGGRGAGQHLTWLY